MALSGRLLKGRTSAQPLPYGRDSDQLSTNRGCPGTRTASVRVIKSAPLRSRLGWDAGIRHSAFAIRHSHAAACSAIALRIAAGRCEPSCPTASISARPAESEM